MFAGTQPALWHPEEVPAVLILDTAPFVGTGLALPDFADWPGILVDRVLEDGRHMVLADGSGLHRLWLRPGPADRSLAYLVIRDDALVLRQAMVRRFEQRMTGARAGRAPPGLCPTPFQRQRLSMLLDILDAAGTRNGAALTTYEIARRHVYARLQVGQGSEWKSSSQRRRTQRLIDEARALMEGGYRRLLRP
ncbi:DUF2285 domain-containing protein [Sphingobium yanoikuyae]|uniref:DUF2285 domain-containing protein n=1 Tax=Sphingobium yanoikuyae TaxID=13690 RepID=A0A9X7YFC1_SPHYA|nr:DUF2285 domain-containing protein [Sphingobium yanoikuyae]